MQENGICALPARDADRLIAAHDGDVALLYIWLCRNGSFNADRAARELCRTLAEIRSAYEKLQRITGSESSEKPRFVPAPAQEIPEYSSEDIISRSREDSRFATVLNEAGRILGRTLSRPDMNILFGIYDYLALPPEVILLLLNYCVEVYREKYGSERRPSMHAVEREAYAWVNREIITIDSAEEYIRAAKERRDEINTAKAALGIRGRELTATERKYISSWLEMGFKTDVLAIAYDRTVTNTGSLKWSYMNKIMQSWHEKGLHSERDIEEKDSRSPGTQKAGSERRDSVSDDEMSRLRSIYEKVKNG